MVSGSFYILKNPRNYFWDSEIKRSDNLCVLWVQKVLRGNSQIFTMNILGEEVGFREMQPTYHGMQWRFPALQPRLIALIHDLRLVWSDRNLCQRILLHPDTQQQVSGMFYICLTPICLHQIRSNCNVVWFSILMCTYNEIRTLNLSQARQSQTKTSKK